MRRASKCAARSRMDMARQPSQLSVHRAVLRKRADLATRGALARKGRCQKDQRPLVVGAHLRFATSSRSFVKGHTPTVGSEAVRTEVNGINNAL